MSLSHLDLSSFASDLTIHCQAPQGPVAVISRSRAQSCYFQEQPSDAYL